MDHEPVLISTIAVGLMAAFVGGFLAKRIGLPTIVGYIVAGVLLGPFTPGLSADVDIAIELADIGIILLMFGVGSHFSLRDLAAVRGIASPGALIQIVIATILGLMLGVALGWGSAADSSSGCRCRWPARSSCCARSRTVASPTPPRAGSRSAG